MQNSKMIQNDIKFLPLENLVEFSLGGDWGKSPEENLSDYVQVKVIRGTEFGNWAKNKGKTGALRKIKKSSLEKRELKSGDLVVEISGGGPKQPVGRVIVIDDEAVSSSEYPLVCSNFFRQIRLKEGYVPDFVRLSILLDYISGKIDQFQTSSTNLRNLNFPDFLANVLIPSLGKEEQERIAGELMNTISNTLLTQDNFATAKKKLQSFKRSVITVGVTGKLTENWRENHPNEEKSLELLEKIKNYKLNIASNQKIKTKIELSYSDLVSEIDFELPEGWLSCRIDHIGEVTNGSTPSRKIPSYWNGDIPWVSSGEVTNNIIENTRETITQEGYDNSSVKLLPKGTVLIAMIGEGKTRGRSAILNIEATTNQNIAAVKIVHGLVLPEYLWYWFQFQYENTRNFGGGSSQQALNCQRVRDLPFVLPPLLEQKEIVNKIKYNFDLSKTIEMQIEKAETKVSKLTQSVLSKTFREE